MACYDYPEIIIHDAYNKCGRYKPDGVCTPLPRPQSPFSKEEQHAENAYHEWKNGTLKGVKGIRAYGITVTPDTVFHPWSKKK